MITIPYIYIAVSQSPSLKNSVIAMMLGFSTIETDDILHYFTKMYVTFLDLKIFWLYAFLKKTTL